MSQAGAAEDADGQHRDALFAAVYDELRRLARTQLARERPGHTLQPTALVHEAWMRLSEQRELDLGDRARFLGLAATMMRRILVNHARDRAAEKRGGGAAPLTLSAADDAAQPEGFDVLLLHDALETLAALDARQARVVELKFFAGLEVEEIAAVLDVSSATVRRDWTMARMWLGREMAG